MRVIIGGRGVYDSDDEPILLILGDTEKALISRMGSARKFLSYPEFFTREEAERFIDNYENI